MSKTQPQKPPKSLLRQVGRAIAEHDMIRDGDRLLLGLSGGKDSLSLLHVLRHLQAYAPVRFELGAATIDPQIDGFDPTPLGPYLESLNIPHYFHSEPVVERAREQMRGDSFCSFCSRIRRSSLYTIARDNGYNVLVLAQHLDDLAESFLMSAFHQGKLETMKAHYTIDAGDLRVIRPLVYIRERQLVDYAAAADLPVIPDNCPACFSKPTKREYMKQLLAREEREHKHLFANLKNALKPLMSDTNTHTPTEENP